jgi:1-acyl-sn-glycerol-3-phosphate acyltransferase
VALFVTVFTPIGIGLSLLFRKSAIIYSLARFCIRTAGLIAGVRVRLRGRENIAPGEPYLVLSNHQSNLDSLVLAHILPRDYRALMKQQVMHLPVMSFIFKHLDFVGIDRADLRDAHAGIDRAASLLRGGLTFIAFPEGTRSRDGRLGEFKKGVFVMALKSGRPILPVTIRNSRVIQPPRQYRIHPGIVDVVVHPPIPTVGRAEDQRSAIAERTRAAIQSAM